MASYVRAARHGGVRFVIRIAPSARCSSSSSSSFSRTVTGRYSYAPGIRSWRYLLGVEKESAVREPASLLKLAPDDPDRRSRSIPRRKKPGPYYNSGRRGTATVEFYLQGALIPRRSRLRLVGLLLLLLPLLPSYYCNMSDPTSAIAGDEV